MNLESTDQTNSWWSSSVKHQTDCQCQQQHTITTTDGNTVKNISVYFRQTKISISHALTMLRTKLHTHTHTHTSLVQFTAHNTNTTATARQGVVPQTSSHRTQHYVHTCHSVDKCQQCLLQSVFPTTAAATVSAIPMLLKQQLSPFQRQILN